MENQVVGLAAEGLTNPQIAERLFVARGTVKIHLSHIFSKLGVSTRAELASAATRRADQHSFAGSSTAELETVPRRGQPSSECAVWWSSRRTMLVRHASAMTHTGIPPQA